MPFYADAADVYALVGGVFRAAAAHPEVGSRLAALGLTMQLHCVDPEASLTVRLHDPMVVEDGGVDADADLVLRLPADIVDRYWRGEYNLAVGIAKGKIDIQRGTVEQLLDLVPLTKPLFPIYREMVAGRDTHLPTGG